MASGCDSPSNAQKVSASVDIKAINAQLRLYEDEGGSFQGIKPGASPEGTNRIIMALLSRVPKAGSNARKTGYFSPPPDHLNADGALVDPWGMPYLILISHTPNTGVNVGRDHLKQQWAVWSSGENKLNEWGDGDDISSWR